MTKKFGGKIENWQLHRLSPSIKQLKKYRPELNIKVDRLMRFTGTVVEDPTGRFAPGFHMRSSLILDLDEKTGVCETENTMYILVGEEGGDVFPDLGDGVMKIQY